MLKKYKCSKLAQSTREPYCQVCTSNDWPHHVENADVIKSSGEISPELFADKKNFLFLPVHLRE
jgi:hypothetical protein